MTMKKSQKRILITLCVVLGIVAVLSVALRIMLTKEVLMDLVVPRLERAVQAEITARDIGVRFPFGFGVDIKGLSFEKTLPQGEVIGFESETIVARASLLSLLKRKPVIKSVSIENGRITAVGGPQRIDARVEGLEAGLSMQPVPEGYRVITDILASSVVFALREKPPVDLGAVGFDGEMMLDAEFDSLHIDRGTVRWRDIASFALEGGIGDLRKSRRISLGVSSKGIELPQLVERMQAMGLVPPAREGKPPLPAQVRAGTLDFESSVSGSLAQPSGISVSGTAVLGGVALEHPVLPVPIAVQGGIRFSESSLRAEGMAITFGSSKITAGFDVGIVDRTKIGEIHLTVDAALRIEDLLPPQQREALGAAGSLGLKLDIIGGKEALMALLPAEGEKPEPAKIGGGWKGVRLQGAVSFDDVGFASAGSPFRLNKLKGNASIDGGDVKGVEVAFRLNGSPYSCQATLTNLLPSTMELLAKSKELSGRRIDDLGPLLREIESVPRFALKIQGRSLDLRPFEKKKEEDGTAAAGKPGAPQPPVNAANPFAFLALKNTAFEARIDSVVATKALFTGVEAKGTIREGLLTADPVTLQYAGGRGRARFEADLRKPKRIESKLNVSFEEVHADRALGAMHPLGKLISGSFSFTSDASFASGPGLDPLASLSGMGSALSTSGSVDISRFIAPLTQTGLIDLSHLAKFDFREWRGNFLLRDGRLVTENWTIKSNRGDWAIKGSFGLDGTLDYAARLVVPPAVQTQMKDLARYRDLVDLFRDAQGNLVLDLDFGGTSKDPKVSIDMSGAREKAAGKARDELLKKAKDLFKK
jgi:hypothetical protein